MKKEKITKFSDFVYYYKWHVVVLLIVAALLAYFVRDCTNKVENDVSLAFMLSNQTEYNTADEITADLTGAGLIPDLDGDGINQLYTNMMVSLIDDMSETGTAVNYQISIEFAAGESMLFIIDEDLIEVYEQHGAFADISEKAKSYSIAEEDLYIAEDGTPIGISLKGNEYLESKGIVTDTLYACFRNTFDRELTKEEQAKKEVAEKIFDYIIMK